MGNCLTLKKQKKVYRKTPKVAPMIVENRVLEDHAVEEQSGPIEPTTVGENRDITIPPGVQCYHPRKRVRYLSEEPDFIKPSDSLTILEVLRQNSQ